MSTAPTSRGDYCTQPNTLKSRHHSGLHSSLLTVQSTSHLNPILPSLSILGNKRDRSGLDYGALKHDDSMQSLSYLNSKVQMPVMSITIVCVTTFMFREMALLKALSCSIECYKSHQDVHAADLRSTTILATSNGLSPKPPPVASVLGPPYSHRRSGDPSETLFELESLESSVELQRLYLQYPRLRDQLKEIYESTREPSNDRFDIQSLSRERGGYRGRSRGRGHGYRRERVAGLWSQQKGFKAGLHQLRELRPFKGDEGEGLRGFSELVSSLGNDHLSRCGTTLL